MSDSERTAAFMTPAMMGKMAAAPAPVVAPSAQLLRDPPGEVGREAVAHLAGVRRELEQQVHERDLQPLASEFQRLHVSLEQLDFEQLRPRGWLARTTGKARSAGAEFFQQYEQAAEAAQAMGKQAAALQKLHVAQVATTERLLVEMEVECSALEQTVEQNARWLQGVRKELQQRHASAADAAAVAIVKEDAARCELLVARLKTLRAVAAAAQRTLEHARGALVQRLALLQTLEQGQARATRAWNERLSGTAAAAERGEGGNLSIEAPQELHHQMQQQVAQTAQECALVQRHEAALAVELAALSQALDDAAA